VIREAGRIFPGRLAALDARLPPWRAEPVPATARRSGGSRGLALPAAHPASCDALAGLLGCAGAWQQAEPGPAGAELLGRHPETASAPTALRAAG
jgi:hypothetical protein